MPSVPCGSTGPDSAWLSCHVSSGLVESRGHPFESTKRNHAPAICEVTTAVIECRIEGCVDDACIIGHACQDDARASACICSDRNVEDIKPAKSAEPCR